MRVRRRILQDISGYLPSTYVAQAADLLIAILTRRFLGPPMMGVWAFCQVLINYAKYTSLGGTDGAVKEIPYYMARGNQAMAETIQNVVFTLTTLTALVLGFGIFAAAWIFRSQCSVEVFWGLISVSFLIVLQRIHALLISFLRVRKDFTLISKQFIVSSAVNGFLVLLLASRFQLYGYLVAVILTHLMVIGYVQGVKRFPLRFSFERKKVAPSLRLGFPLMVWTGLILLFSSMDKLVMSWWLGLHALGLYSLALMAHHYLFNLPNQIGVVLFPYSQEHYQKQLPSEGLTKYVLTPMTVLCAVMPIAIGLTWLAAPVLTAWVLPQFLGGVRALQILILGTFFLSLYYQPLHFLITTHRLRSLLVIGCSMIAVNFVLNRSFVGLGWGINGVAAATAISYFLYFCAVFFIVGELHLNRGMARKAFSRVLGIFLYFSFLLWTLHRWVRVPGSLVGSLFCQIVVYLLGMIPLILWMNRKTDLFAELRSVFAQPPPLEFRETALVTEEGVSEA